MTQGNSDSESSGLVATHALSLLNSIEECAWITDSGATCHVSGHQVVYYSPPDIENSIDVMFGDGRALTAIVRGEVALDKLIPNGESKSCKLHDVLYVPTLAYIQPPQCSKSLS